MKVLTIFRMTFFEMEKFMEHQLLLIQEINSKVTVARF